MKYPFSYFQCHSDAPEAVTAVAKENEKTESETGTPDKAESVCDSEATNVPTGAVAVPVKDFQDRTEGKEKQPEEEVETNAKTQNEEEEEGEEEEEEEEDNNKKTKKKEEEKRREDEEGEKLSVPDSNKSESTRIPEVKSSSPEPYHSQGNVTEPMEICSGVDAMDREQNEDGEKVSFMLFFLTWLYFVPPVSSGLWVLLKHTFFQYCFIQNIGKLSDVPSLEGYGFTHDLNLTFMCVCVCVVPFSVSFIPQSHLILFSPSYSK